MFDCGRVQLFAQVTQGNMVLLHSLSTLSGKAEEYTILKNLVLANVLSAEFSGFTTI